MQIKPGIRKKVINVDHIENRTSLRNMLYDKITSNNARAAHVSIEIWESLHPYFGWAPMLYIGSQIMPSSGLQPNEVVLIL